MKKLTAFVVIMAGLTGSALACQFDTDCNPGSQCIKQSGAIYGMCMGGIAPGNSNDQQPAQFFPDINQTRGNTCSFDTDCGPGGRCMKGAGIYGTCA